MLPINISVAIKAVLDQTIWKVGRGFAVFCEFRVFAAQDDCVVSGSEH
jgi:hypothetical protein